MIARAATYFALICLLVVGALFTLSQLAGCGEEECLVDGENCSSSYKKNNYGTTEVYCCTGSCRENSLGDLVCR